MSQRFSRREGRLRGWRAENREAENTGHGHGALRRIESLTRPEAIEFFLRLHVLWEARANIPPPPNPPFDIDTFEPIEPPWPAIREWVPADDTDPQAVFPEDTTPTHWVPKEIRLDDERTLVLDPS